MAELNENTNVENEVVETETEEVVFTDAQKAAIAKLIQSESDRRTNQALAKQKKEYEKKLSLASLDGAEREKAEKDSTIAELREQLAAFTIEKNRSELKSVLASRNLDPRFADIITISDDITEAQANIDLLDTLFKASVKAEVEKRLAATGGAPKGNSTAITGEITKEQFKAMPLSKQAQIARENPELYKKLTTN
jgi:hypothetical protein